MGAVTVKAVLIACLYMWKCEYVFIYVYIYYNGRAVQNKSIETKKYILRSIGH